MLYEFQQVKEEHLIFNIQSFSIVLNKDSSQYELNSLATTLLSRHIHQIFRGSFEA